MGSITVRQLSDEVHRALRAQAAKEGISAEEKARRLLTYGLFPEDRPKPGDLLCAIASEVELDGTEFQRDRSGIEGAAFE